MLPRLYSLSYWQLIQLRCDEWYSFFSLMYFFQHSSIFSWGKSTSLSPSMVLISMIRKQPQRQVSSFIQSVIIRVVEVKSCPSLCFMLDVEPLSRVWVLQIFFWVWTLIALPSTRWFMLGTAMLVKLFGSAIAVIPNVNASYSAVLRGIWTPHCSHTLHCCWTP